MIDPSVSFQLNLWVRATSEDGALAAARVLLDRKLGADAWDRMHVTDVSVSFLEDDKEDKTPQWAVSLTNQKPKISIDPPQMGQWNPLTPGLNPGFPRITESTPAEIQKLRDEQAFLRLEGVNPKMLEMLDDFQQNEGFTPLVDEQELLG